MTICSVSACSYRGTISPIQLRAICCLDGYSFSNRCATALKQFSSFSLVSSEGEGFFFPRRVRLAQTTLAVPKLNFPDGAYVRLAVLSEYLTVIGSGKKKVRRGGAESC